MGANLKGSGGIKGLFLLHGEKIAIALVGLLAMWFVYSSLNLPRLEDRYQASQLQQKVNQANLSVTDSKWPEPGNEGADEVRPYTPIHQNLNAPISDKDYAIEGINPTVLPPTLLRSDPEILNAADVIAYGNSAMLAFIDQATLQEKERRRKLQEEELRKKEMDAQKKLQEQAQQPENERRRGRDRNEGEGADVVFDPAHPERRMIQGISQGAGVPVSGAERIERVHWATVVAKVPIRKQRELFKAAFENARGGYDLARDFPRYMGFIVERSVVEPGKPLEWKRVPVFDGQKKYIAANQPAGYHVNAEAVAKLARLAEEEWAGMAPEPVAEQYTDFLLTMQLPPMVGRDFGAEATHPDIPLAINAPPVEMEVEALPAEQQQPAGKPADPDDLNFGGGTAFSGQPGGPAFAQQRGRGFSRGGAHPGGERGFAGGQRGWGGPESSMGRGYSERGPGGPSSGMGGIASGSRTELAKGIDFWLLRFFDFTVEPGKKYKYRVKVALADPNYGIPAAAGVLEPAVLDRVRKEARVAEKWSDPSPTVGIPYEGLIHLAEAKLPKSSNELHNDEPQVTLIAEKFSVDEKDGFVVHVAPEKVYRRGAVINMKEKMKYTGEGDMWYATVDSYPIHTGVTLVDVDGDSDLARDMPAPSRVLLMDATGQMSIRDEMADQQNVRYLRYVFGDDKKRNRTEEGGRMPFGPEGPR